MNISNHKSSIMYLSSRVTFFLVMLAVWNLCYASTLAHVEDVAFYANTTDITHIQFQMPKGWLHLVGNFISQFYIYPLMGASIQALFSWAVLLLADAILWHITRNASTLWISYIPTLLFITTQNGRNTITYSLSILLGVILIAILLLSIPRKMWQKILPVKGKTAWNWKTCTANLLGIIAICLSLTIDPHRKDFEYNMQLEQWAASHEWSKILDTSYPQRYKLTNMQLSYSLLALSEQGRLADKLFTYPVKGLEDLYDPTDNNPVQCRFNSFFCAAIGFPNEAIRYAFEEGQGEEAGISFGSTRRMVDWLIDRGGDMRQVDFYLNLLQHSSCNQDFVKTRKMAMLGTQRKKAKDVFFVGGGFVVDAYRLYQMNPANQKALDYMLCGLLLMQQPEEFYASFSQLWNQHRGQFIPRHYEEALVMLTKKYPKINVEYDISAETTNNYHRFLQLLNSGKDGLQKALAAYGETYWGFLLKMRNSQQKAIQ